MMGGQPMTKMRRRDREVTDLTEIKAIVEKNYDFAFRAF